MSKQYLTAATVTTAHKNDIFALAATDRMVLSAGSEPALKVHDTTSPEFPLLQSIPDAHRLGCHHLCASRDGKTAASAGFAQDVKLWTFDGAVGEWVLKGELPPAEIKAGEVWAIALGTDGSFLAVTTHNGRINVWDVRDAAAFAKIHTYETISSGDGSFGMCVDISRDGKYIASGHQDGSIYVFNHERRRLLYTLTSMARPVRAIAFSPAGTRIASGGDTMLITLYDMAHGEQVGSLQGHRAFIASIDWSETGEWLLSSSLDGRVKVWSVERAACVSTHSETSAGITNVWAACWLPKTAAYSNEMFCAAGQSGNLTFYREASGM